MPTQDPSKVKVCRVCREDCSDRPRTKDRAGNYYCKGCYEQATRKKKPPAAPKPKPAPLPDPQDDSLGLLSDLAAHQAKTPAIETTADTCEHCSEPLPPGAALCMSCGFNRKTGQRVQGASLPSDGQSRGGIAGTLSNEPSIGGAAILDPERASGVRPYFQDMLATLMFPKKVGSLISFIVMWVVLVLGIFGASVPIVGLAITLMVAGWYAAYRIAILASSAAGDEEVSMLSLEDGIVDGIVYPLIQWVGTWAVAFLPVIVFAIVVGGMQLNALLNGVSGILAASGGIVVATVALVALGLFLWPMFVLCVSLGGFSSLVRFDLILRTILRTFPVYLLTVAIVMGTQFIDYAWREEAQKSVNKSMYEGTDMENLVDENGNYIGDSLTDEELEAATRGSRGKRAVNVSAASETTLLIRVFGLGVTLYLEIIAMRAIGLYYFHFKRRFAWDWG